MANILIDPIIVAIPPETATKVEIENWFKSLRLWLEEATNSFYGWYYSWKAIYLLQSCSRYPQPQLLQEYIVKHKIDISLKPILQRLNELLRNEQFDLQIKDWQTKVINELGYILVFEHSSTGITPNEFSGRWPSIEIYNEMIELLVHFAACKYAGEAFTNDLSIATLPLPETAIQVQVVTTISASEPELGLKEGITQNFDLVFTPGDLPLSDKGNFNYRRLAQQLISTATHLHASKYEKGKHVNGQSNDERRNNAKDNLPKGKMGNGQYLLEFDDAKITELEKEAIANGRIELRANENVCFITYTFPHIIGFAAPTGEPTKTILTEWTSRNVHSHPI